MMLGTLGAIGAGQYSEGVSSSILSWAEEAVEEWLEDAKAESDSTCIAGAEAALKGLDRANAWLWTDEELTDRDGNRTDALTELNDPVAVQKWLNAGATDEAFPGGDLTKLDVTVYGEKQPDGRWKIRPSGHLAFTIAHEALHWLPGGGPNHTLPAFADLESCHTDEEDEEEDEPNEGGGENPTEPVCEEKLVPVYYVVDERELRRSRACTASDDVDGTGGECRWVYEWVLVPKQKVKWETQTVCSS